jgi:Rod binding domain-containing protein
MADVTAVAGSPPTAAPAAPLTAEQQQALKRLHEVAQQWEGVFIGMVFKEMRKSESDQTLTGEKSNGEKIFSEMLDQQRAEQFSQTGAFGLGRILEDQLRSAVLANAGRESKTAVTRGGL